MDPLKQIISSLFVSWPARFCQKGLDHVIQKRILLADVAVIDDPVSLHRQNASHEKGVQQLLLSLRQAVAGRQ